MHISRCTGSASIKKNYSSNYPSSQKTIMQKCGLFSRKIVVVFIFFFNFILFCEIQYTTYLSVSGLTPVAAATGAASTPSAPWLQSTFLWLKIVLFILFICFFFTRENIFFKYHLFGLLLQQNRPKTTSTKTIQILWQRQKWKVLSQNRNLCWFLNSKDAPLIAIFCAVKVTIYISKKNFTFGYP